jgi:FeS assembly SUF system protein
MSEYLDEFLKKMDEGKDAKPVEAAAPEESAPPELAKEDRELLDRVIAILHTIYDPEIPVDIYELGLVYEVHAYVGGKVRVQMTLTTPHCPVAETMPDEVIETIKTLEGVEEVDFDLVWDPPWDPSKMSEAARLELGFM